MTTMPQWRRIAAELRERIVRGDYADGFPGEWEIAEEFGVSRGTVRSALRPLRDSGLVTAGRGRRPQITQVVPSSQYGAIYSLHEIVEGSGRRQTNRVREQRLVTDAVAAGELLVPADASLFHLARVRLVDDEPVAQDALWSPATIAGSLLEVDFTASAFYRELRDHCDVTLTGGQEHITAVAATIEQADLLGCPVDTPLLRVARLSCAGGAPVEYRISHFRPDRFSLTRPFGPQTGLSEDALQAASTPLQTGT